MQQESSSSPSDASEPFEQIFNLLLSLFGGEGTKSTTVLIVTSLIILLISIIFFLTREGKKIKLQLEKELANRQMERTGRVRAEQKIREIEQKLLLQQPQEVVVGSAAEGNFDHSDVKSSNSTTASTSTVEPFPFLPIKPIGYLRSVYKTRNGCPRQPYYVNKGRAILKLLPHCNPSSSMDGLGEYSHCYIIFQFNLNTNLTKGAETDSQNAIKAKIRPPRLGNKKIGIYASRTPHRYNAIGLSIVEIDRIDSDGTLHLKGTDLVDGTAILDIKPYIDGYDNFSNVRVPEWIRDPLDNVEKFKVEISEQALTQLRERVHTLEFFDKKKELNEFIEFLTQVLSQDIRSNYKKTKNNEIQDEHELLVDRVKVTFTIDSIHKIHNICKIENA